MNLIARLVDKLAERDVVSCDYGQSFEMVCCRIVIATSVECGLHSRQISGWYWIGGVGCYSQGPSQHGETGCQEHHEVQNSNCKVLYLDWNSALQQYRLSLSSQKAGLQKKSRGAGGQVKNRSAMPLCSKNGQSHAVQGCKGTDIPFPLSTGEIASGTQCPVLGSQVQEGHCHTRKKSSAGLSRWAGSPWCVRKERLKELSVPNSENSR